MAPILKDYPRASFDKIEFPFTSRSATLEARTHTHEYPKQAGGFVEKLGRKLWEFTFEVPFHTTFENFPNLYPGRLDALTERCARLDTAALLVPEIGTIRCILTRIERKRQGRIHSGEDCTLRFIEDDLEPFRHTTAPASKAALSEAAANLSQSMTFVVASDLSEATIQQAETDLGNILDLADFIGALGDQTTLFGLQVQGKLSSLTKLCRALHSLLKGPDLDPVRRGLRDLWNAAYRLQQDLTDSGAANPIRSYIVPTTLAVGQIAQRLYNDAARGGEILALNRRISDPYSVRAGTPLVVYTT